MTTIYPFPEIRPFFWIGDPVNNSGRSYQRASPPPDLEARAPLPPNSGWSDDEDDDFLVATCSLLRLCFIDYSAGSGDVAMDGAALEDALADKREDGC
uniref:Uncharacterized protein n=1 Tax=Oryza glaberrima TaxID=4538 RepID=A0A679BCV2_ORYGL|nr:hypothetical protein [Oryza glaberrima]BBF89522.1 hypothetical protein [Oryza glaberrima]